MRSGASAKSAPKVGKPNGTATLWSIEDDALECPDKLARLFSAVLQVVDAGLCNHSLHHLDLCGIQQDYSTLNLLKL